MTGAVPISSFPSFPSVPSMTAEAQDFVDNLLLESRQQAVAAVTDARNAIDALQDLADPIDLPSPPTAPPFVPVISSSFGTAFDQQPDFGSVDAGAPQAFLPDTITIPNVIGAIPTYVPAITGIDMPSLPEPISVTMPIAPDVETDFDLPAAPVKDYGFVPDITSIVLPEFATPTLEAFDADAPTFEALVPNGSVEWNEPTYVGQLTDTLKATLQELLAGGTGIDAVTERAIWERDRDRLTVAGIAARQQATQEWEARGFALPGATLLARTLQANRDLQASLAAQSRDVAIKQADLEQGNRRFAVENGIALERIYVEIFLATMQRSFEIARYAVEASIQIFNGRVAAFNVEQAVYGQRIAKYRVGLEYAQAQIAVYKGQIEAAQVQATVNHEQIEAFRAKVQAFSSQADAYRALVQAATARAEMQKNKVDLYRAQIDAVVATIQSKKSEYDAYIARVDGEAKKVGLEEANARSFQARVQAITASAELSLKDTDAQIARARMKLDYQVAELQRIGQLSQQQLQSIQARVSVFNAQTQRGTAEFEAERSTHQLELTATAENARVLIQKYATDIEVWKSRVAYITQLASLRSEAMRAAAQVTSTLAAGALAGTSVSASFNGSVSRSENTSQSQTYSSSQSTSDSTSSSNSTSFNHNFDGV